MFFRKHRLKSGRPQKTRRYAFEKLEDRRLLIAEAEPFNLSRPVDLSGVVGTPSATINWGDGTTSPGTVVGGMTTGGIKIRFDYSYSTNGFFDDPSRRASLEAAASLVTGRFSDTLSAIERSGTNTWVAVAENPLTGEVINIDNLNIPTNEVVVFVGARELGSVQLAQGGFGGLGASGTQEWIDNVQARGQAGALGARSSQTDFAPWGGTLTFDVTTNWYFGITEGGLQSTQQDFITVATHELLHLFGFGTSPSWTRLVSGNNFTGSNAQAEYDLGGNIPLDDASHFRESITDGGRKTIMGPRLTTGKRELPTALDLAAMDDIGWTLVSTDAVVTGQHVYADNGNYTISITGGGSPVGQFADSSTVSITNALPSLIIVGNQTVTREQRLSITDIGRISDPGFANNSATPATAETFTYTINWGDGSAVETGVATIDRIGSPTSTTLASFDGAHVYTTAGTFTVTVQVSDDDGGPAQSSFQVVVAEPPVLTLELNRTSVAENAGAGAATLTIRRSGPASALPTAITLSSSDESEATVTTTVFIPEAVISVTVPINAVDDTLLDGSQSVTFTATSSDLVSGTITLEVTDRETLTGVFTAASVREDAVEGSFFLTITRSNTDTGADLLVAISGNVLTEIDVPLAATIPAGSASVRIAVQPINDTDPEPTLLLTYQFAAVGYNGTTRTLSLFDDEPPFFQNLVDRFNADGVGDVIPLDALRIINALSRRNQRTGLDPNVDVFERLFPDVNGDYLITPLDALQIINEIARRRRGVATTTANAQALQSPALEEKKPSINDVALTELSDRSLF